MQRRTACSELHPAPPPERDALPYPLTFFLTALQRRRVVRALRRIHPQRTTALLMAIRSIAKEAPIPADRNRWHVGGRF